MFHVEQYDKYGFIIYLFHVEQLSKVEHLKYKEKCVMFHVEHLKW